MVTYKYMCLDCREFWVDENFHWDHCPFCGSFNIDRERKQEWEDT
jgi:rRNA maturation endonuclease Nob1